MGDVLWYLNAAAARGELSLGGIAGNAERGDQDPATEATALTFASLQPEIMPRSTEPSPAFEKTLLQLAGEVGLLVADEEAGLLTNNQPALAARLIAILRTLVQGANEAGVTLAAAAVKNLGKIFDRWPQERTHPEPLDRQAPTRENGCRATSTSTCSSAKCAGRPTSSSAATGSTSVIA